MANMEKPHLFCDKNQKLTADSRHLLIGELFMCMRSKNCIQDTDILSTPAP